MGSQQVGVEETATVGNPKTLNLIHINVVDGARLEYHAHRKESCLASVFHSCEGPCFLYIDIAFLMISKVILNGNIPRLKIAPASGFLC